VKVLNEPCEWFDQEHVVCRRVAAVLLNVSEATLECMVDEGIGPPTFDKCDIASGFLVWELWEWAKRVKAGPFIDPEHEALRLVRSMHEKLERLAAATAAYSVGPAQLSR
jgi:hypothetical protein